MCYKLAFCIIAKSFFSISQDIVLITCNYNLSREEPVELHDNSNWIPEKAMATHSSTLAWKIPRMEEPGRLQYMGSLSGTQLSYFIFTFMHWRRKWQPTPVFLPEESQGRGSLVGCRLWGRTESDTTEVT